MASVFRRRITQQVISTFKPFLKGSEGFNDLIDCLPLAIKFNQPKNLPPQFELSWKSIVTLKPDLQERIHPNTVLTYLKNQEFPNSSGIVNIYSDNVNPEKFIFEIDQELFASSVILDVVNRIDKMPFTSSFFRNIPPERVIVEYSSPNIAKPFHFGHFRSTILGNFISNLCAYVGHQVTRLNYVGDWGLQYGILAVGFVKFGSEEELARNPLNHLFQIYRKANELIENDSNFNEEARAYFKRMEEGDPETLSLWRRLRDLSLKEMTATYKRLGIEFDEFHGESMYANDANEVCGELIKKGLALRQEDGSVEVYLSKEGENIQKTILRKSDGTTLYLSRDLAAVLDRHEKYRFDSMYYVVDSSQKSHFVHLKQILDIMGHSCESNVNHVPFGRISNFSTRKGTAVFLHDILDEARDRTLESMKNSPTTKVTENLEEVADNLGISSLIVNDFGLRRKRDYPFDWEKALNIKGNCGTSLQYCHARLNNIKENCGVDLHMDCEFGCLTEPEAISLIAHLAKFDEAIYHAYVEFEPCNLVHYLFILNTVVGRANKVLTVKGSSPYVARARLLLFHTAQLVMQKSLQILGITPLNKM